VSALISLHDCIFMVHQFRVCVHPAIAVCLLCLLAGTTAPASAKSLDQSKGSDPKRFLMRGGSRFSQEHEMMFRNGVLLTYIIGHDEIILTRF